MRFPALILLLASFVLLATPKTDASCRQEEEPAKATSFTTLEFPSQDGLQLTADLYLVDEDRSRPLIVLCHQARTSRGEYREIAPKLNGMGFNCLAIDQRSGGEVNGVSNETAALAQSKGMTTTFVDAEQDMLAAIQYARDNHANSKLILWGSSYSSALALKIAGDNPGLVDGVLAFAPGEYFQRFGKPADWIASSAKRIAVPAFITSAKKEYQNWSAIFETIPGNSKMKFLPKTDGNHGSRALWEEFDDSAEYWRATGLFLDQFQLKTNRKVSGIEHLPVRIAFGSCSNQNKPQPVLETVVAQQPDLFIYLGDNIYGDTRDMEVLQQKYDTLAARKEFQKLRQGVPVLAIWDDHDYGWNDAGKEYEKKAESREIFLDFWEVPADSPRREHEGIYGSHLFQFNGRTLQIILLDTRTFRDSLKHNDKPLPEGSGFKNAYQPVRDPNRTLLGNQQWEWLAKQLREPADLRIICSSIQFGHEYNGWESWTNLPLEQERMISTIRETGAQGVVFLSGDVHWGEISKREIEGLYPLYDITASGLTEDWYNVEPNRYRIGDAMRANHFGQIEIDWSGADPKIAFQIIDVEGNKVLEHAIVLSEIGN